MSKLSVIIPVYNEERTVGQLLNKVIGVSLPKGISKEIIVVDDGSTDGTSSILNKYRKNVRLIRYPQNRGKGAAVRSGFGLATGDWVLIQDADLEYNPEDYSKLLKPLANGAEVVYGTRLQNYPLRFWGKNRTPMPFHWISNHFLSGLTNLVYQSKISDMETCYKLLKREIVDRLNLRCDKFDIEPEITTKLLKKGYKIVEVPIQVKPRNYNAGKKIGWKDGFQAIWAILKFRFYD